MLYRRFSVFLFFFVFTVASIAAQGTDARNPASLYSEAAEYKNAKIRELQRTGKRLSQDDLKNIEKEQAKVAAENANILAARPNLAPGDILYLGLLYNLADNADKAVTTLRQFLAMPDGNADGNGPQAARATLARLLAEKNAAREAEQYLSEFRNHQPQGPVELPSLEGFVARAFLKAKDYAAAQSHARAGFDLLKAQILKRDAPNRAIRNDAFKALAQVLVETHKKLKQKEETKAVLAETMAVAYAMPSTSLYRALLDLIRAEGEEDKILAEASRLARDNPAPELEFAEWLDQAPVTLSELRGRVVLLDFWYHWCGPCIASFPTLSGWHKKYQSKGLTVLGVTSYTGEVEDKRLTSAQELDFLRGFKKRHNVQYGFAVANGRANEMSYEINAYPTAVLLDRRGVVRYFSIGFGPSIEEKTGNMIKKLLEEKE
jgi:thiol-disulfide isomerase/thioredoxin